MKEFHSIDDILDFAINAEQEAVNFYTSLADRSKNAAMKQVFVDFAREEMKHKSMLMGIREHGKFDFPEVKVRNLRIADYLVNIKPSATCSPPSTMAPSPGKSRSPWRKSPFPTGSRRSL